MPLAAALRRLAPPRARRPGLLPLRSRVLRPRRPRGVRPSLDRRLRPALGRRGRRLGRHRRRRGRQRRDRRAGGPEHSRARERRRTGDAGLHGWPPALPRWRIPARQRGPPPGESQERIHRAGRGLRRGAKARRVDRRRRVGPRALARHAAAPPRAGSTRSRPNNPVLLYRLDGHMALANSAALRLARIGSRHSGHPGRGHRPRSRRAN